MTNEPVEIFPGLAIIDPDALIMPGMSRREWWLLVITNVARYPDPVTCCGRICWAHLLRTGELPSAIGVRLAVKTIKMLLKGELPPD
jgi:hypothetical protein